MLLFQHLKDNAHRIGCERRQIFNVKNYFFLTSLNMKIIDRIIFFKRKINLLSFNCQKPGQNWRNNNKADI